MKHTLFLFLLIIGAVQAQTFSNGDFGINQFVSGSGAGSGFPLRKLVFGSGLTATESPSGTFTLTAESGGSGLAFNVKDYGALGDTRKVTDGVANGTTTVTSATANFTTADVGKQIWGNNSSGALIIPFGSIVSVTNATTVIVSNTATGSASGLIVVVGTDDSDAIIAANAAAEAAEPRGAVYAPAGGYLYSKFLFNHAYGGTRVPPAIIGDGSERTVFFESANFDYGTTGGAYYSTFAREANTTHCLWRGFTVDGATVLRDYVHAVCTLSANDMALREDFAVTNFRAVLFGVYIAGAGEVWRGCRVRHIDSVGIQCAGGGNFENCYVGDCVGVGLAVANSGRFIWSGGSIDESSGGSATFSNVTDLRFSDAVIYGPANGVAVALSSGSVMRAVNSSIAPFGGNNNTTGLSVASGCAAWLSQCRMLGTGTGYALNNAGTVYDGGGNEAGGTGKTGAGSISIPTL